MTKMEGKSWRRKCTKQSEYKTREKSWWCSRYLRMMVVSLKHVWFALVLRLTELCSAHTSLHLAFFFENHCSWFKFHLPTEWDSHQRLDPHFILCYAHKNLPSFLKIIHHFNHSFTSSLQNRFCRHVKIFVWKYAPASLGSIPLVLPSTYFTVLCELASEHVLMRERIHREEWKREEKWKRV